MKKSKNREVKKTVEAVSLPETGFVRLAAILSLIPISKSTWWMGIKDGRYPQPVKLSPGCTAWRVEAIRALIEDIEEGI